MNTSMTFMEIVFAYADKIALIVSLPILAAYFFFGVDDLIVDIGALLLRARPKKLEDDELSLMRRLPEKRLAVMVASWKESGVLKKMVMGNVRRIQYGHYDFFLGVYPNDPETVAEAEELALQFPNVRVVVNSMDGPTSKGQMINEMARAAQREGLASGDPYGGYLIHDSEDLIHPLSFSLINWQLDRYDFVQVPIFSLPVPKSQLVAGTYIDEFSEFHTKDILLRERLGVAIPSAGVGTAVSAELVRKYTRAHDGDLLNERSLTEDYELGVSTTSHGLKSTFACFYVDGAKGEREFIATREYFPKSFLRSIRQRSRWTLGIAFQGSEHLGWSGGLWHRYFLYRDRKGPVSNLVVVIGGLCFIYLFLRSFSNPEILGSNLRSEIIVFALGMNAFFMMNRILQRMVCVVQVYGFSMALSGIVRIPVSHAINALATIQAIRQYSRYKFLGEPLKWVKTEHELPEGFGAEDLKETIPPSRSA